MHLTLFTDFALRTMMYLTASPEKPSSVKEIAEYYGVSRNHLVKVVHRLGTLGFIETTKGRGGGIRLSVDPMTIRLGDIVQQLENMEIVECFNCDTNSCRISETCRLKNYLYEAGQSFIRTLNKYSLQDAVTSWGQFPINEKAPVTAISGLRTVPR